MVTPILNRRFFQDHPPSPAIYQKWREFYEWTDQILPVYEWQDVVYVGCLALPKEFPLGPKKVVFCLCDMESLSITWERFNGLTTFVRSSVTPIQPIGPMKSIETKPEVDSVIHHIANEETQFKPASEQTVANREAELAESPTMMIINPDDFGDEVNEETLLADLAKLNSRDLDAEEQTLIATSIDQAKTAIYSSAKIDNANDTPTAIAIEVRPVASAKKEKAEPLIAPVSPAYEAPDFSNEDLSEISVEKEAASDSTPATSSGVLTSSGILAKKDPAAVRKPISGRKVLEQKREGAAPEEEDFSDVSFEALSALPPSGTENRKDEDDLFGALEKSAAGPSSDSNDSDPFSSARTALTAEGIDLSSNPSTDSEGQEDVEALEGFDSKELKAAKKEIINAVRAKPIVTETILNSVATSTADVFEQTSATGTITTISRGLTDRVDEGFRELASLFKKSMLLLRTGTVLRPYRWDAGFNIETPSQDAIPLATPSPFRVVDQTQKPYHGSVYSNELNDKFFLEWNEGQLPEHLTLTPILVNDHVLGMVLSLGDKSSDSLETLETSERVSKNLSEYFNLETQNSSEELIPTKTSEAS